MHSVELLEESLRVAAQWGYQIRQEWLDGGGGACEVKGQRWLFVDLSRSTTEQLYQVLEALEADGRWNPSMAAEISLPLAQIAATRKAA
jgi:hypothetical protein